MKAFKSQKPCCHLLAVLLCSFILPFHAHAQYPRKKKTHMLLMLDCSSSMNGFIGGSKVEKIGVAKKLISRMVDSLSQIPDLDMGLHTYGDRYAQQDCNDTHLNVPFDENNAEKIKKALRSLDPKGTTPIAKSLIRAQDEFPADKGENIIILVTDGFEECGGDPCAASKTLQERGITLKPFIIGIGLSDEVLEEFHCVGRVYNTKTEKDLSEILNMVVSQALNNTTVEVDLNDQKGRPTFTDANLTFYNSKTHEVVNNYYHTFNKMGRPDTFKLDPVIKYDLQVNTTPPIIKKQIELKSSKHNIISVDASQGSLYLISRSSDPYNPVSCLVREEYTTDVIYVQDVNTQHKYLSGSYDLEVLTLPKTYFKNVKISENQVNKLEIPQSGHIDLSFSKDIAGSIFVNRDGVLEWVIDLTGITSKKESYNLQPGEYKTVYRLKTSRQTEESITKEFKITSGSKIPLILN